MLVSCLAVAACWGATQPFLKRSSGSWYIFWMAANLSGSLLYYYSLQDMKLSFAIPLIQGLSVFFNLIISCYFDADLLSIRTLLGTFFILTAISINF